LGLRAIVRRFIIRKANGLIIKCTNLSHIFRRVPAGKRLLEVPPSLGDESFVQV
jgi:hypothetical protein